MKHKTLLASAIALALCGPAWAADEAAPSGSQYDSAVGFADYRDASSPYTLRASEVIGKDVRNASDETIGEVDDLIVPRDGSAPQAVVSVGGFLGMGSKLVLVPYEELRVTADGEHLYYNATKDELNARAEFKYAEDEETADARAGSVAPAAAGGTTGVAMSEGEDADNSGRNERDRDDATLTPGDQSNADQDVDITRSIRKELVADDSLGTDAQNVKVITIDGEVTLRGPVESSAERTRVVDVAKQVAGADRVKDELEVANR
jgi:osmotically-inducible protein OsmY